MSRLPGIRRQGAFAACLLAALMLPAMSAADTTKQARSGDVASRYLLQDNGNLFRFVGNNKCQVTNNVADFKVSQHPDDAAMIYFVREEGRDANLYVLHNAEDSGRCPKARRVKILENVARSGGDYQYSVVPNTNTKVVAIALSEGGRLVGWDDDDLVVDQSGVKDYRLHNNYNQRGKPFRRYAAFAIDRRGRVFKIEGNRPQRSSFHPNSRYDDLREFWAQNLSN